MLALDGVSTSGHAGTPLESASLAVRGGEIVGIAGVSGNGQKALAGVISGTLAPSEGSVAVRGKQVSRLLAQRDDGARASAASPRTA